MATSDPTISLLPQPSQPTPIEPMRGGGTEGVTDPTVSLLPQPSVATPIEPMRGGGDQVGTPTVSLLPQPSTPVHIEPMKGGAIPRGYKITEGEFKYYTKNFEEEITIESEKTPEPLNVANVSKYINRRTPIWQYSVLPGYKPPLLDPQPKNEDQEGFLNYFLNMESNISLFFVDSYVQFVNIRKFIKTDFENRQQQKRNIYLIFCLSDDITVYSNLFRGIVLASADLPGSLGDIFLISQKSKMHSFNPVSGETKAINLLNRVDQSLSIGSKKKTRFSYEPSVFTLRIRSNTLNPTSLAFSGEKLNVTEYTYFGLNKEYTINLFGIQYFPKDSETTLYFSTKQSTILLSTLKPDNAYEIKHFKYDSTLSKYINLFKKGYIAFHVLNEKPVTPFRSKTLVEDTKQEDIPLPNDKTNTSPPSSILKPATRGRPKKRTFENLEESSTNIPGKPILSSPSSSDTKAKDEEEKQRQLQLEKDMELFRTKVRDAISEGTSSEKLVKINLNGVLYPIRAYSTNAWKDWGNLKFISSELDLLDAIGIYEPLFTTPKTQEEKEEFDFYQSNIQSFFNDLGNTNSQCFREERLLLTYECNKVREFLQKHYEIVLKKNLNAIGKYAFQDLSAFQVKDIISQPPPPPGSASTTGPVKGTTKGPGISPGVSFGAVGPSGPAVWGPPYSPDDILQLIQNLNPIRFKLNPVSFVLRLANPRASSPPPSSPSSSTTPTTTTSTPTAQYSQYFFATRVGLRNPRTGQGFQDSIPPLMIQSL